MIDAGSSITTALFVVAMIVVALIVSVAVTCYVCGIKLRRVTGSGNATDTRRKQL